MAKKRKPFNKFKQLSRFADHILKDIVVCYTTREEGCRLLNVKKQCLIVPDNVMANAIAFPHFWSCYLAVFGRTALGEEYMKSEQIITQAKHCQEDLAPTFEKYHAELIKRVPEHQRIGVGWIASPNGVELTEKEAGAIFAKLRAWDDAMPEVS